MNPIYDFETAVPPPLNEAVLQQIAKQKQSQLQIALLAISSILILTAFTLLGLAAAPFYPLLAWVFFLNVAVTTIGSGAAAIIYTERKRCLV